MHAIFLNILNQSVELKTAVESMAETLSVLYRPFVQPSRPAVVLPGGCIEISINGPPAHQSVRHKQTVTPCETTAQVLYTVDKIITVELQVRRPELFFVHAAAVSTGKHAILIVGEPGAGKSTLCWSLCDAGYGYLSDELAPVSLVEKRVYPFPRALSLKSVTQGSSALPDETIDAGATLHIPADSLPGGWESAPLPIAAIVFLLPEVAEGTPGLLQLPVAEAAARLYANGLNQLAHEDDGLKAAAGIANAARNSALTRTDLPRMVAAIGDVLAADQTA